MPRRVPGYPTQYTKIEGNNDSEDEHLFKIEHATAEWGYRVREREIGPEIMYLELEIERRTGVFEYK